KFLEGFRVAVQIGISQTQPLPGLGIIRRQEDGLLVGLDRLLAVAALFQTLGLMEKVQGLSRDPGFFLVDVHLGRKRPSQEGQADQDGQWGSSCRNFQHYWLSQGKDFPSVYKKIAGKG